MGLWRLAALHLAALDDERAKELIIMAPRARYWYQSGHAIRRIGRARPDLVRGLDKRRFLFGEHGSLS